MTYLLSLFLLFVSISVNAADDYLVVPALYVYDGDTIFTRLTLPPPLDNVKVRIAGIDTPERPAKSYVSTGKLGRAECIKEAELALDARSFLINFIADGDGVLLLRNFKWGKYGSRIIADVQTRGTDLGQLMIRHNLAVPYDGGTKTHSWCD